MTITLSFCSTPAKRESTFKFIIGDSEARLLLGTSRTKFLGASKGDAKGECVAETPSLLFLKVLGESCAERADDALLRLSVSCLSFSSRFGRGDGTLL